MKPLIYAYIRVQPGTPDDDLTQMELTLKDVAEQEGYCFATIFHEHDSGSRSAFYELVAELKRAEARHVIVPSLEHLSGHQLIRSHMLMKLEHEAGAQVMTLLDRS